jgi:Zn-dependent protease
VVGTGPRGRLVAGVPRAAFRPSGLFLGLVALFATSGLMAWRDFGNIRVDVFLFVASGWVISLCLHEYAHALLAYRGGDLAVADRGYLTLNPLRYTHPVLSIVLPLVFLLLGGIGLPGGAVWVDHHAIRNRVWDSLVSFAGPATNFACALVLIAPLALGVDTTGHQDFWAGVAFLALLQLMATVLNFMPIPGIDGGNLVEPWLSPRWRRGFAYVAPWGMLLLFALLSSARIGGWFFNLVFGVGDALGLPDYLAAQGYHLFRFWSF